MKKITLAICATALLFASCNNSGEDATTNKDSSAITTTSSDKMEPNPAPKAKPDSATMMKNWEAYMTPGDIHKMIASWNGTWNGEMTHWQAPGAPPETIKVSSTNKMALGGRYQISTNTGNMMGMPFEGISTLAYDNARKVFINTWIDNFGTGMMVMEGTWDEATKTLNLKGRSVDPMMGDGSMVDMRQTMQIVDDKNQVMEMFGPGPDGKEYKVMVIKMSRK